MAMTNKRVKIKLSYVEDLLESIIESTKNLQAYHTSQYDGELFVEAYADQFDELIAGLEASDKVIRKLDNRSQ